eukprot:GILK01008715.1.p1 GENE.GILK01008715.1~~GILK01008715.1.p1  ORF type:complete len:1445 (+),score=339.05 GILK01008715.1:52-4386(+)
MSEADRTAFLSRVSTLACAIRDAAAVPDKKKSYEKKASTHVDFEEEPAVPDYADKLNEWRANMEVTSFALADDIEVYEASVISRLSKLQTRFRDMFKVSMIGYPHIEQDVGGYMDEYHELTKEFISEELQRRKASYEDTIRKMIQQAHTDLTRTIASQRNDYVAQKKWMIGRYEKTIDSIRAAQRTELLNVAAKVEHDFLMYLNEWAAILEKERDKIMEQYKQKLETLEEENRRARKKLDEAELERIRLTSKLKRVVDDLSNAKKANFQLQEENKSLKTELQSSLQFAQERARLEAEIKRFETALSKQLQECELMFRDKKNLLMEVEHGRKQIIELQNMIMSLTNESMILDSVMDDLRKVHDERVELKAQVHILKNELNTYKNICQKRDERIRTLKGEVDHFESENIILNTKVASAESRLAMLDVEKLEAQTKLRGYKSKFKQIKLLIVQVIRHHNITDAELEDDTEMPAPRKPQSSILSALASGMSITGQGVSTVKPITRRVSGLMLKGLSLRQQLVALVRETHKVLQDLEIDIQQEEKDIMKQLNEDSDDFSYKNTKPLDPLFIPLAAGQVPRAVLEQNSPQSASPLNLPLHSQNTPQQRTSQAESIQDLKMSSEEEVTSGSTGETDMHPLQRNGSAILAKSTQGGVTLLVTSPDIDPTSESPADSNTEPMNESIHGQVTESTHTDSSDVAVPTESRITSQVTLDHMTDEEVAQTMNRIMPQIDPKAFEQALYQRIKNRYMAEVRVEAEQDMKGKTESELAAAIDRARQVDTMQIQNLERVIHFQQERIAQLETLVAAHMKSKTQDTDTGNDPPIGTSNPPAKMITAATTGTQTVGSGLTPRTVSKADYDHPMGIIQVPSISVGSASRSSQDGPESSPGQVSTLPPMPHHAHNVQNGSMSPVETGSSRRSSDFNQVQQRFAVAEYRPRGGGGHSVRSNVSIGLQPEAQPSNVGLLFKSVPTLSSDKTSHHHQTGIRSNHSVSEINSERVDSRNNRAVSSSNESPLAMYRSDMSPSELSVQAVTARPPPIASIVRRTLSSFQKNPFEYLDPSVEKEAEETVSSGQLTGRRDGADVYDKSGDMIPIHHLTASYLNGHIEEELIRKVGEGYYREIRYEMENALAATVNNEVHKIVDKLKSESDLQLQEVSEKLQRKSERLRHLENRFAAAAAVELASKHPGDDTRIRAEGQFQRNRLLMATHYELLMKERELENVRAMVEERDVEIMKTKRMMKEQQFLMAEMVIDGIVTHRDEKPRAVSSYSTRRPAQPNIEERPRPSTALATTLPSFKNQFHNGRISDSLSGSMIQHTHEDTAKLSSSLPVLKDSNNNIYSNGNGHNGMTGSDMHPGSDIHPFSPMDPFHSSSVKSHRPQPPSYEDAKIALMKSLLTVGENAVAATQKRAKSAGTVRRPLLNQPPKPNIGGQKITLKGGQDLTIRVSRRPSGP